MIARCLSAAVLSLSVLSSAGLSSLAEAAPATCKGADLMAELAATNPKAHAGILAAAAKAENSSALLWKIERADAPAKPPSYLFGTVHLTDARVTTLTPAVTEALGSARALALEIEDPRPEAAAASIKSELPLMLFSDGRGLDQLLSPEEFARTAKALGAQGFPEAMAAMVKPWTAALFLAVSPCEAQRGKSGLKALDVHLFERAKQRGIKIVGLETGVEQLRSISAIPEAEQIRWLKASVKLYDRSEDMMETMLRLYQARQIGGAFALSIALADMPEFDAQTNAVIERELSTRRNHRMAERTAPLLAEGGAFIAVGALHLIGREGLVELLRGRGYTVTAVE